MVAYPIPKLPAGIPGTVHRMENAEIITETTDPTLPFPSYGVGGAINAANGRFRPIGAGDTDADVYGLLVRTFPGSAVTDWNKQGLGQSVPPASGKPRNTSVMIRGFMDVKVNGPTAPVKNGAVFIRVAQGATDPVLQPIGGFEAAADGANTIQLTRTRFRGPADAYGNTEIAFRI